MLRLTSLTPQVFMSVAVIPFVEMERAVFLREKRNGAYTAAPYVRQFIQSVSQETNS
jgi:hypothetical protein